MTTKDQSPASSCIGNLEHHIHKVFASVRVPGEDFVYSASTDLFNTLDDYCDDQTINEPKAPLIILGESGAGKSALLSNWLVRRKRLAARSRNSDEFVFWHAVGCSRQSLNVNSLIRRLIVDLKERFELTRDVPLLQERLSWELPRFLDQAAKRGRLLIVIDGLQRLVTNDDSEANLAWLPLTFPGNVRVVLSATVPANNGPLFAGSINIDAMNESKSPTRMHTALHSSLTSRGGHQKPTSLLNSDENMSISHVKGHRILLELERRKWMILRMKPLEKTLCRAIIDAYVKKSVQTEASAMTTGPFLTALTDPYDGVNTGSGGGEKGSSPQKAGDSFGFLLFDTQILSLLSHPQGGTPLFLRLFLRCAHHAVTVGFSLWRIWDDWLIADSVHELYARIMGTFERGYICTPEEEDEDCVRTIEAGGLKSLKEIYPWHPQLENMLEDSTKRAQKEYSELRSGLKRVRRDGDQGVPTNVSKSDGDDGRKSSNLSSSHSHTTRGQGSGGGGGGGGGGTNKADTSLAKSLQDQNWVAADDKAEGKLELAIRNAEKSVDEALSKSAALKDGDSNSSSNYNSSNAGGAPVDKRLAQMRGMVYLPNDSFDNDSADIKVAVPLDEVVSNIAALTIAARNSYEGTIASGAFAEGIEELPSVISIKTPMSSTVLNNQHHHHHQLLTGGASVSTAASSVEIAADSDSVKSSARGFNTQEPMGKRTSHYKYSEAPADPLSNRPRRQSTLLTQFGEGKDPLKELRKNKRELAMRRGEAVSQLNEDDDSDDDDEDAAKSDNGHDYVVDESVGSPSSPHTQQQQQLRGQVKGKEGGDNDDANARGDNSSVSDSEGVASPGGGLAAAASPPSTTTKPPNMRSFSFGKVGTSNGASLFKNAAFATRVAIRTNKSTRALGSLLSGTDPSPVNADTLYHVATAEDGIEKLPKYMRGGSLAQGLGEQLGNALALLYVARHGLKEQELWAILVTLRGRPQRLLQEQQDTIRNEADRGLLSVCYANRGKLEDFWRTYDLSHTGQLSLQQMFKGMAMSEPQFNKNDLLRLLEVTGFMSQSAIDEGFVSGGRLLSIEQLRAAVMGTTTAQSAGSAIASAEAVRVSYRELLKRLHRAVKQGRGNLIKQRIGIVVDMNWGQVLDRDGTPKIATTGGDGYNTGGMESFKPSSATDTAGRRGTGGGGGDFEPAAVNTAGGSQMNGGGGNGREEYDGANQGDELLPPFYESLADDARSHGEYSLDSGLASLISMGPIAEGSLLAVLTALGLLHSPEHQVLLLSSDSDQFRQMILEEFVDGRGGEEEWHGHMIRHFQSEMISMRRCEELPWHLQICRKWHVLKDALADLKTFDMMFNSELRDEILAYWLLLTEGPMHINDDQRMSHAAGKGTEMHDPTEGQEAILSFLDTSNVLGLTQREKKQQKFRNQVIPFDIIEEFNKSLESWSLISRNSTAVSLHRMISLISKFLLEFAKNSKPSPPFLRPGVFLKSLANFNITFDHLKHWESPNQTSEEGGVGVGVGGGAAAVPLDGAAAAAAAGIAGAQVVLSGNIDTDATALATAVAASASNGNNLIRVKQQTFPTSQMQTSNFYHYLRWIWIQFPWLALHSASAAAATKTPPPTGPMSLRALPGTIAAQVKESAAAAASGGVVGKLQSSLDFSDSTGQSPLNVLNPVRNPRRSRFWDVKKCDPSYPVVRISAPRMVSSIKTVITSPLYFETLEYSVNRVKDEIVSHVLYLEDFDNKTLNVLTQRVNTIHTSDGQRPGNSISEFPSTASIRDSDYMGSIKRIPKFRRTLKQELEAMQSIPFSSHTQKSMREGTLFPTIEAAHRERNRQKETQDGELFCNARAIRKRGGISDPFEKDLEEEIKRMRDDEALADFNRQKGFTMPVMSESEMVVNREIERVERLRRLADRVQERVKDKEKVLERMRTKVVARDQHDESLAADIVAGDCTIDVLETRANAMSGSLEEAKALGEGYTMLLELLKQCPPFTDKHVHMQEQNLHLAKQQLADLMHHRHNMYMDSERIEEVRKRQITDKIMYYRDVRRELREKIKKFYDESMKKKKPIPPLHKASHLTKYLKVLAKRTRAERRRSKSLREDSLEGSTASSPSMSVVVPTLSKPASKPVSPAALPVVTAAAAATAAAGSGTVAFAATAGAPAGATAGGGAGSSSKKKKKTKKSGGSRKDANNDGYSVISFADSSSDDDDDDGGDRDDGDGDGDGPFESSDVEDSESKTTSEYALAFGKYLSRNTEFARERDRSEKRISKALAKGDRPPSPTATPADVNHRRDDDQPAGGGGFGPSPLMNHHSGSMVTESLTKGSSLENGSAQGSVVGAPTTAAAATTSTKPPAAAIHGALKKQVTLARFNKRKEVSARQMSINKDQLTRTVLEAFNPKMAQDRINASTKTLQAKMTLDFLNEKTSSTSEDEFIDRFRTAQKLTESLRAMQALADSKLVQLRSEYGELYESWGDTLFVDDGSGEDGGAGVIGGGVGGAPVSDRGNKDDSNDADDGDDNKPTSPSDGLKTTSESKDEPRDARYLDNKIFATEIHLSQLERQLSNAVHTINEVRTGVSTIMVMLKANSRLLCNLPKSPVPKLDSEADIATCLTWCEDRINAINESMMFDNAKQVGGPIITDTSQPLSERQAQLAGLVQNMATHGRSHAQAANRILHKKKTHTNWNTAIISVTDHDTYINSPRTALVPTASDKESRYATKVETHNKVVDDKASREEFLATQKKGPGEVEGVSRFLREALATHGSKEMLRKANVLENKKQGRSSGLGWALEDLFRQNGQTAVISEVVGAVHTSPKKKRGRMRLTKKSTHKGSGDASANDSGVLGENGFGDTGNGVGVTGKEAEGPMGAVSGTTGTVAPVSPSTQTGNFFGGETTE